MRGNMFYIIGTVVFIVVAMIVVSAIIAKKEKC